MNGPGVRISAGRFKNAALPKASPGVRPVPGRLKTSLFSVIADRVPGARVLDLCAGCGALGLEALSRGAASVVLVDSSPLAVDALARWIALRGLGAEARVLCRDARRGGWPDGPYDLVFLDPPFSAWAGDAAEAKAFVARAVPSVAPSGLLVVKTPAKAAFPEDPRWESFDYRPQGDVAYVLVRPSGPPGC